MTTTYKHVLQIVLCVSGMKLADYLSVFSDKITDGFSVSTGTGYWLGKPEPTATITLWFNSEGEPLICTGCLIEYLGAYKLTEKQDSIAVTLDGVPELLWDGNDIHEWAHKVQQANLD